jgi:chromate transporter
MGRRGGPGERPPPRRIRTDRPVGGRPPRPGLPVVLREWARIGCVGFGGPPAHIALLRELCVTRRGWLGDREFEDAIAATNLLPGPASTQLAIYCAWRMRGIAGALVGGLSFIVPGLVLILALAALFLAASPPDWVLGAGAGSGAAVAAVALQAAASLAPASWRRATARPRWVLYALAGAVSAATVGAWLVLVLLGCGAVEIAVRRARAAASVAPVHAWPLLAAAGAASGGLLALAWVAFKVGALSYGGGFVIIPLMQHDAVDTYHWMTDGQFLNAIALGQVTPGPVVQTVAVVGYAAAGVGGGLLAAAVAFAPSFSFILIGAERFDRLRANQAVRGFLDGAGPAAIGAIAGAAIPLALALTTSWQLVILAAAAVALFVGRLGVVPTLIAAGAAGALASALDAPLPR